MIKTVLGVFCMFWVFNSYSKTHKNHIFKSLDNNEIITLNSTNLNKSLFIAHDCHVCHQLLKSLKKNCSSLDATSYAIGDKKNLKPKLRILKNLNSKVFLGPTSQAFADIGIDLIPYYISPNGEKHQVDILKSMIKDKVCKKAKVK